MSAGMTEAVADLPISVISRETVYRGKWMAVDKVLYHPKKHSAKTNIWECAYRVSKPVGAAVDGVSVIAFLNAPGSSQTAGKQLILIKQFRVPMMAYCIEFPAGLVDPHETVEEAALRELKEETGYSGESVRLMSAGRLPLDPGLTSSDVKLAVVDVDGRKPLNQSPKQQLDDTEDISVMLVPLSELTDQLKSMAEAGIHIEATVSAFALGLDLKDIV